MGHYKIYSNCISCGCEKNPTKSSKCSDCLKSYNMTKIYCKCGSLKEKPEYQLCSECNRLKSQRTHSIKKKINSTKKTISKEAMNIIKFVKEINKRGGYCSMVDLFKVYDLWESVYGDLNKYDNYEGNIQISLMWQDLKFIYDKNVEKLNKNKVKRKK